MVTTSTDTAFNVTLNSTADGLLTDKESEAYPWLAYTIFAMALLGLIFSLLTGRSCDPRQMFAAAASLPAPPTTEPSPSLLPQQEATNDTWRNDSTSTWSLTSSSLVSDVRFTFTTSTDTAFNITLNSTADGLLTDDEGGAYLWLPYIIFTIALLALICCSFLRFHSEREIQYRRRQEELNDKIQPSSSTVQDGGLQRLLADTAPEDVGTTITADGIGHHAFTGGKGGRHFDAAGSSRSPYAEQQNKPQRNGGIPAHRGGVPQEHIMFDEYTQIRTQTTPNNTGGRHANENHTTGNHIAGQTASPQFIVVGGNCNNSKKQGSGSSTARRPLVFTFNINGSMVDIRCGEEERTNTFRLMPPPPSSNERLPKRGARELTTAVDDFDLGVRRSGGSATGERRYPEREVGSCARGVSDRSGYEHGGRGSSIDVGKSWVGRSGMRGGSGGESEQRQIVANHRDISPRSVGASTSAAAGVGRGGGVTHARHNRRGTTAPSMFTTAAAAFSVGAVGAVSNPPPTAAAHRDRAVHSRTTTTSSGVHYERVRDGGPETSRTGHIEEEALLLWQKHL